jgi:hypothetical protein
MKFPIKAKAMLKSTQHTKICLTKSEKKQKEIKKKAR